MMIDDQDLKPCESRIQGFTEGAAVHVGCMDLQVVLSEADRNRCDGYFFCV